MPSRFQCIVRRQSMQSAPAANGHRMRNSHRASANNALDGACWHGDSSSPSTPPADMDTHVTPRLQTRLEDKYTRDEGWLYITGTQALVRLPIQQRLRDAAEGLNTGGYISG